MASFEWPPQGLTSSSAVTSLNGLTGAITLSAGSGITITPSGNTLTFASQTTFPLFAPDGTNSAPSYSFASEHTTGMWLNGPGSLNLSVAGANYFNLGSSIIQNAVPIQSINGSISLAAYSFAAEVNSGMWLNGPGSLVLTVAGQNVVSMTATSGAQIAGTSTNDNAPTGFVGEYVESLVSTDTNVPFASGTFDDLATISLTKGDWDVTGQVDYTANGASMDAQVQVFVSTGSAGNDTTGEVLGSNVLFGIPPGVDVNAVGFRTSLTVAGYRLSLTSTTTVRLKGKTSYSAGTPQYNCRISARRVR